MMRIFEMTDLGELHYFLGLEVTQKEDDIFVSQKKYADDLLERFKMAGCKKVATPMDKSQKLKLEDGAGFTDASNFRSLVGGLIYLTHTRPDISFAVGVISRFMSSPSRTHYGAAKRILRYLSGTLNYGLWYGRNVEFGLKAFSNSDWAACLDDRKSTTGNVFNLGSGAISWCSKKQPIVALSTAEAEYIAGTAAACQGIWVRRLLEDFNLKQQ